MGFAETIPGLNPREPKTAYFDLAAFDCHRSAFKQATTIEEQHTALEAMFLATKIVKIGARRFDTMSGSSGRCVPAIEKAGIKHAFEWLGPRVRRDSLDGGGGLSATTPRLARLNLPRQRAGAKNAPRLFTSILYDFKNGTIAQVRTVDRLGLGLSSYPPEQTIEGTVFAATRDYISRCIESQLVAVNGMAYFDKPEALPGPVPYTERELMPG